MWRVGAVEGEGNSQLTFTEGGSGHRTEASVSSIFEKNYSIADTVIVNALTHSLCDF